MDELTLLLLVVSALCFGMAAFGVVARINWIALGLLCWVLTALLPRLVDL